MAAQITFNQPTGAGPGTAGKARNDIWVDQQVDLVSSGTGSTFLWELLNAPPGSAATITDPTLSTATITPDVIGTYRISLTVDGGGVGNNATKVIRARYDNTGVLLNRGWALPAVDEEEGEADYGINDRHWAEVWETIIEDIRVNGMYGNTLTGDVTGILSSSLVENIQGLPTSPSTTALHSLFAGVQSSDIGWVSPRSIVRDGDYAWLAQHDQSSSDYPSVDRVLLPNATRTHTISISAGSTTGVRDLGQDNNYVYAACWTDGHIAIISKTTHAVVGWGSLTDFGETGRQVTSVCADNAGNFYVIGWGYTLGSNVYGIFKFVTADCIGANPDDVGPTLSETGAAYDRIRKIRHAAGYLWITSGASGGPMLIKVDPATLSTVASTVSTNYGMNVAYNSADSNIYVTDTSTNQLHKIDPADCSILGSVGFTPDITQPDGLAFGVVPVDLTPIAVVTGTTDAIGAVVDTSLMSVLYPLYLSSSAYGEVVSRSNDLSRYDFFLTSYVPGGDPGLYLLGITSSGPTEVKLPGGPPALVYKQIDSLRGQPVSNAIPAIGQVLTWDGDWHPEDLPPFPPFPPSFPAITFVYNPYVTPQDNVYDDWSLLMAALATVTGPKIIEIASTSTVPPGTWDFGGNTILRGQWDEPPVWLFVSDGCVLQDVSVIEGGLTIIGNANSASFMTFTRPPLDGKYTLTLRDRTSIRMVNPLGFSPTVPAISVPDGEEFSLYLYGGSSLQVPTGGYQPVVSAGTGSSIKAYLYDDAFVGWSISALSFGDAFDVGGGSVSVTINSPAAKLMYTPVANYSVNYNDHHQIIFDLLKGLTTDSTGVATVIGAAYIDASRFPVAPGLAINYRVVKFRCILESSSATQPAASAHADLYDVGGSLGAPAVVTGSPVDTTAAADQTIPDMYESDVTAAFASFTGAGVFEARLWINTAGGGNSVTCKSAQLIVEW